MVTSHNKLVALGVARKGMRGLSPPRPELTVWTLTKPLLGHVSVVDVLFCESAYRTVTKSVYLVVLMSLPVRHENWTVSTCPTRRRSRQFRE